MFSKIVALLDGGAESAAALGPARTLARMTGAVLVLVACPGGEDHEAADRAQSRLGEIVRDLKAAGIPAIGTVRPGDAGRTLVELSHNRGVRLIVMAAQQPATRGEPSIDPLCSRVLAGSTVPVLLLRSSGRRRKLRTLMVPWDGPAQQYLRLDGADGARESRPVPAG